MATQNKISTLVTAPTEPDPTAAMVQAVVNPSELGFGNAEENFRVLPNTLVFTKPILNNKASQNGSSPPPKRARKAGDKFAQVVGGAFDLTQPLYVLGVAYDGIPDPGAAKHWPDERGRLAVQVSGTCTIAAFPQDLDNLEVLDRLELARSVPPVTEIASVKNYNIIRIKKFDENINDKRKKLLTETGDIKKEDMRTLLVNANYEKLTNLLEETNDVAGNDITPSFKNEIKRLAEKECRPFAVLLEKGHESARILLTPG